MRCSSPTSWVRRPRAVLRLSPAAAALAGHSRITQPLAGLFVGPAGNREALGESITLNQARVALGRFGAMHRRGGGGSTRPKQIASHLLFTCGFHVVRPAIMSRARGMAVNLVSHQNPAAAPGSSAY